MFDDDGKDFRSSIFFSKEMKRQLGLAPGFPLELTHNPNPKLEIPLCLLIAKPAKLAKRLTH